MQALLPCHHHPPVSEGHPTLSTEHRLPHEDIRSPRCKALVSLALACAAEDPAAIDDAICIGKVSGLEITDMAGSDAAVLRAQRRGARAALADGMQRGTGQASRDAVDLADAALLDVKELSALFQESEQRRARCLVRLRGAIQSRGAQELQDAIAEAVSLGIAGKDQRAVLAEARVTLRLIKARREAARSRRARENAELFANLPASPPAPAGSRAAALTDKTATMDVAWAPSPQKLQKQRSNQALAAFVVAEEARKLGEAKSAANTATARRTAAKDLRDSTAERREALRKQHLTRKAAPAEETDDGSTTAGPVMERVGKWTADWLKTPPPPPNGVASPKQQPGRVAALVAALEKASVTVLDSTVMSAARPGSPPPPKKQPMYIAMRIARHSRQEGQSVPAG